MSRGNVKNHAQTHLHSHALIRVHITETTSHRLEKNVFAARRNAAGFSRFSSSDTVFNIEAALCANERCPAAVLAVGGRRHWSCLVMRSQGRASAKVQSNEASSSGSPSTRTLWATIAIRVSYIWRGVHRPRSTRARDTWSNFARPVTTLAAKLMTFASLVSLVAEPFPYTDKQ